MGTRGFFGFRVNGEDKLTYNHNDSYPDGGLGDKVVEWARGAFAPNRRAETEQAVRALEMVDSKHVLASADHIRKVGKKYLQMSVGGGNGIKDTDITYYRLLRGAQPSEGVERVLATGVMSRFSDPCEDYGYVINLDERVVEIYDSRSRSATLPSRYTHMKLRGIYPIEHIETWRKIWKQECWPNADGD